MNTKRFFAPLAAVLILGSTLAVSGGSFDEGMYPLSMLKGLDLAAKGFEIPLDEIFSPDKPSLIYAVNSPGGGTGSFVSPDGLFITNHHIAFSVVQAASTPERDYLRDGFLAPTKDAEIQAKGMTVRITESFRDVSAEVLSAIGKKMSPAERAKALETKIKKIVADAEKKNPGKRAEVSEMFPGRTYVLFLFTYLKDIRITYVPPRSIGEFGGEDDNWMWPRHTGDFSFLRAYTAPDGSPADYSPANIPFKPKRFLKIQTKGVAEGDLIFILGYPGRTVRHRTASAMAYDLEVRMPYSADWSEWQIALMEKAWENDAAVALKCASKIKGLANGMKNYRGKIQGLKKVDLVSKKRAEEEDLRKFIAADPALIAKYGDVLPGIDGIQDEMRGRAEYDMVLENLRRNVNLLNFAWTIHESSLERAKPDLKRESAYMDRNWSQTSQRLLLSRRNFVESVDRAIFRELIMRALSLDGLKRIAAIDDLFKGNASETAVDAFVAKAYGESHLAAEGTIESLLEKPARDIQASADPFLKLAAALAPSYKELKETQEAWKGRLDPLLALFVEIKEKFVGKDFIPDANSTLRLTFGRIKGYKGVDAVAYKPFTTLAGILEKTAEHGGKEPFYNTPAEIIALRKARDFGRFEHPALRDVPVCHLYDADTTGGNSGSPVLNARGELVGVNFDRTYDATINDYAWNADYSRSIAVDIRYVLWVAQKYSKADALLKEIGAD